MSLPLGMSGKIALLEEKQKRKVPKALLEKRDPTESSILFNFLSLLVDSGSYYLNDFRKLRRHQQSLNLGVIFSPVKGPHPSLLLDDTSHLVVAEYLGITIVILAKPHEISLNDSSHQLSSTQQLTINCFQMQMNRKRINIDLAIQCDYC